MRLRPRFLQNVPLARKISLLFGAAVLLTIAVTLLFPWLQMTALDEQAMLVQAKRVASAAYQAADLQRPDWSWAQTRLAERWPLLARQLGLPLSCPQLVRCDAGMGHGFQNDAITRLQRSPRQRYYWRIQDEGHLFRLAAAVRGTDADPHPDALQGIIDVRLPIPGDQGVWNSVVTVLAGASGAVLAILMFYVVTQRLVLSPVHTLRRVAESVTVGDLEVRAPIKSGDEFQALSDAFNEMLAHLRAAQEEQQKINRSLDIKLGELAETNVALYESNRLKSEFLTNVTHELRTPLVSIIGFAELLRDSWEDRMADQFRLARYTENILSSARSLLDIINDLLDLAKVEAGRMECHLSRFFIGELCTDMIDFVRPLADKRNQTLELLLAPDLPECTSDSGKIKQILYNLLSNAVKFTPTGGSIFVTAERDGTDLVRLVVRDTGPGIPKDKREIVFEQFRQLDASESREHEGTGLGLAITKELVHMLGGRIRLEGEEGKGAAFVVELPVVLKKGEERSRIRLR